MAGPTNRRLLPLVLTVDLAALAALLTLPGGDLGEDPFTILLLAVLAAVAGARPVRISALRTEVTATHPFIFCALALGGAFAAGLVAFAGVGGAMLAHSKRPKGIRVAFNVGAVALSTALMAWGFLLSGGTPGDRLPALIWPLTVASAAYFAANTGLVAVAIAVEKEQPFTATWKDSFQWTTVGYVTGLSLAVALLLVLQALGLWGLVLGIPPCWFLAAYYRANKERLEEHQRRIQEIEELNADLERRVEERTHELQEALEQIEELQALKETLTQTLVHDLKNPLTAIVGNLDLLERKGQDQTVKLVRRSKAGASRLLRMILDLLDISSLEDGRFVLEAGPVDAVELARRAVEDAESAAAQRDVQVTVEAPDDSCTLQADTALLRRVLDNLLANALHHSPARSVVTVTVAHREEGLEFGVADQGPGIPLEYREKVFEKYARLEVRQAGVTANRGLGLTFCQLAVEAHGGTIWAEEAPGGGALFRVVLPVAKPVQPVAVPVPVTAS
jgi:signal transduction histidine kinase